VEDIRFQIFAYIVSQVETPLVSAVADVFGAFLTFVGTPLKVALVLYVALTGLLLARGETSEPGSVVMGRAIKMAVVVWFLTGSGTYQQWVYNFFFQALPNGLSDALTSSGAVGAVSANSFDQVWVKAWTAGLQVWRASGYTEIGKQFCVIVFWLSAILSTVFCFAIWLISRVILALYIALGPLLIGLVLFPATRAIFERWIGSLISCVILQVTTIVLLYIVLTVEQRVIGSIGTMTNSESMTMIQVLLAGIIFFGVAAFVALQLPGVASSLSGGLSFHTGALARGMQQAIGSTGRSHTDAAGNVTRQGRGGILGGGHAAGSAVARGASAGGRALYQRIRPSTGGSLSDRSPGV
jgi:type IV secretion system protein VirB6